MKPFSVLLALATSLICHAPLAEAQSLTYTQILERKDTPQPDHKVAYGKGPQQYVELWLPTSPGPHPVVVLIHGGCWLAALPGPELLAWQADALRKEGMAVWSISYRRLGHDGGGYPGTFQDIASGIDHLRTVAARYQLDLNRVVSSGHSAGGHLALWAAARPKLPENSPLKTANPLPIRAVVTVAGIPDLANAADAVGVSCGADTIRKLVDEPHRGKSAWLDTSPASMIPLGVKQILVSGIYDGIVAPVHAWRYQNRPGNKGEPVSIVTLESGHFELISPWTEPGMKVVTVIVEQLRDLR